MGPDRAVCSAKGCQADAVWDLQWNNPKIHPPERRKSWLAESLTLELPANRPKTITE